VLHVTPEELNDLLLVHHLGPAPLFPISGALLALSMAYGLTQREFRDFGTPDQEPSLTSA
jgi:hypothetical protein